MQRVIISIIFLGAAVGMFFTWTKPTIDEIKSLQQQEGRFNYVLANSRELQIATEEVLAQYNSIEQENLERLKKILPPQMEAIKLIIEIESIVKRHGLLFKNINIEKPNESEQPVFGIREKEFETISLNMVVVGSYESFLAFLDNMEKSLHLIDVEGLSFQSGKTNFYEFNIKANTYWKK